MTLPSPYLAPGFYDRALAEGRHRDIVGGRWDETPRIVLPLLAAQGLGAEDVLLDVGAGALRLGRHLAGQVAEYWATDLSRALMLRGWEAELDDATRARVPQERLVGDAGFSFEGVTERVTFALAFAVFTHLPAAELGVALRSMKARFPALRRVVFTVFLAPAGHAGPFRQADGVVTHGDRFPWHMAEEQVVRIAAEAGFAARALPHRLPRGQVMFVA